jgi:outer membrane protein TolC
MVHQRISFLLALLGCSAAWAQSGLTLSQAVEQALQNNLETRLAAERATEARARRAVSLSALLPQINGAAYQMNLTANLAAMGLSSSTFPGIPAFIGPYNRFDARVQMVQSLFNLESIRRYQSGRLGVQIAAEQRRLAQQQVTTAAALAYIAALEAGQSVAAAEANVQLAQRLLDLAGNQRTAGIATGLDVTRAETRLAGQQVTLAQAQTNLDTARLNLLRVTGAPLASSPVLADRLRFAPAPPPATEELIRQALDDRLELRLSALNVRIAQYERKAALGGFAPSVSVFGDYGSSGLKPNEVNLATRSIGVRIDVPIFNGGRTHAELQAAGSRLRQAELQQADLRAAVEKDIRQALDNLSTRAQQMRAAEKNLTLAERELSLARDRFAHGVADNIEVTNAQTALENARQLAVSSLAQYNLARLNLDSARGHAENFTL